MSNDNDEKKNDRPGGGGPGRSGNLGKCREVNDQSTLEEWKDQVTRDSDVDYKVRFVLQCLALQLNRRDWAVHLMPADLLDEIDMPSSSFYKYLRQAVETKWVEELGEHLSPRKDRDLWRPKLKLVIPE